MDARIFAAAALFVLPIAAHAQTYTVTDLGAGYAGGINDSGQVAGTISFGSNAYAAVWTDGTPSVVGPSGAGSYATGINDSGVAVGTLYSDNNPYAVAFRGSTAIILPGTSFFATAINNSGVSIGTLWEGDEVAGGVWSAGCTTGTSACTVESLRGVGEKRGLAEYFTNAFGINNAGVVVGTTYFSSPGSLPTSVATVWHNGNPSKLGYLPGM